MSSSKRRLIINSEAVKLGCSCRTLKLSSIFNPKPKRRASSYRIKTNTYYSSSSSWDTTTATYSSTMETSPPSYSSDTDSSDTKSLRAVQGFGKIGVQSVAVEKDSEDPYLDFRQSMLQMILEKEIYSKDELKELLNCFLQLNSPYYHGVIFRAFTEIWNGVFSAKSSSAAASSSSPMLHGDGCHVTIR